MSQNGKGDKNNRIKDWRGYWANFDSIFSKDKKDKKQSKTKFGEWHYDSLHETWSRIENGVRVWYDRKIE